MGSMPAALALKLRQVPALRAFRHRDFRFLWAGAFFSFTGMWVQSVAQGWLVYELTNNEAMLALVAFVGTAPVALLAPFAGVLADMLNRRRVLVACQVVFAANALLLALATGMGFVQYWHILVVSAVGGMVGALEMPTRQSLVGTVVPIEDLSAAVPVNAMTFNLARILGPAIGGILLAEFGAHLCYLINGISYLGLILAVLAIRADLNAVRQEKQSMRDLLLEGMIYTWRETRLRVLFLMEIVVSTFGLFYLPLMPAIARDLLGLDKKGLGQAMSAIGVGAMASLITLLLVSHLPIKALLCRVAMSVLALCLIALSIVRDPRVAFVVLAVAGAAGVMQFNTTNTLFQLIAPERLRGRVLAMHVWALSGIGPIALPAVGWFAHSSGIPITLVVGGAVVGLGAGLSWVFQGVMKGVG